MARCGKKKLAAIALSRKVLCILYHLLMNHEDYQEPEVKNNKLKNTELCSAHKHDGYRQDDKNHQSGRILGGERFEVEPLHLVF